MQIQCIAIDDEPLALRQINDFISQTPFLKLVKSFQNAFDAIDFLGENQVDLMFLDINMPDLNGLDFIKSLENSPGVIFTTAYSEYAIDGFKVNAIDYLLKPIGYSDFLRGANKAKKLFKNTDEESLTIDPQEDFLFIKSEYRMLRINLSDIKYVEGMREYVRIHTSTGKPVMSLMSMKSLAEYLPESRFMRVHRSFIVNLEQITIVERNRIVFGQDVYIPISEQYKTKFHEYMRKYFPS